MTRVEALAAILTEYRKAVIKHPDWPDDTIHAVATVGEESGEALQAALNEHYHDGSLDDIKRELCHTGATVIRALMNL